MSTEEDSNGTQESTPQYLTAEYKDGQLQIVEMTHFGRERMMNSEEDNSGGKYMQVIDGNKSLMQLDLVNLTLVRCQDMEDSYRLVANAGASVGDSAGDSATVACVLQSSDTEAGDEQDSQQYVLMGGESNGNSLIFLQDEERRAGSSQNKNKPKKALTPAEILEKAKALQKVKTLMNLQTTQSGRGRKRKSDLPPPSELLASPNFKLYLYSCKLCSFKCNAIKDMSKHKASEHSGVGRLRGGSSGTFRSGAGSGSFRSGAGGLQCARCPYRATSHSMLMKHVRDYHVNVTVEAVSLDTEEVDAADVLVCGACGFESSSKTLFRVHIEDEHGAKTC